MQWSTVSNVWMGYTCVTCLISGLMALINAKHLRVHVTLIDCINCLPWWRFESFSRSFLILLTVTDLCSVQVHSLVLCESVSIWMPVCATTSSVIVSQVWCLINDWAAYESGVHHVLYIVFCNWITISIFVMQSNLYVWCHLSGVWHWETPMVLEEVAFVGSLYVSIPTHSCCIPNSLYLYVVSFLYSSLFLLSIPTYSCIDCPVSLRWWCWQTPIMFKGARADDEVSFFNTNATPLICSSTPTYISTLFCSVLLCILINFILLNSD